MRPLIPSLVLAAGVVAVAVARPSAPSAPSAPPPPAPVAEPVLSTAPDRPVEGTLFRVRARWPDAASAPAGVGGTFAEQPLHFAPVDSVTFEALAAAPLDAPDTLVLRVTTPAAGGGGGAWSAPVRVVDGDYRLERLTVAPQFGRPLSSELAARVAAEGARASAVSRAAHETPRLWEPPFAAPRPGRITSPFGRGREYNGRVTGRHTGTDYAGAVGAPVHAPARGVVRLVDRFYLGGNVVYVDHGAGLTTAYLHLSRTAVAPGDTVERGDRLGDVGATGRVTGPHLHWIVRYGTISVDGARALRDSVL